MKKINPLAEQWFKLCNDDLEYALLGLKRGVIYNLVCFHCQQAVEKCLKGFLTLSGIRFHKTHKLEELAKLCEKENINFSDYLEKAKYLDGFYIETRYAGGAFGEYGKREAEKAIEYAQEIINFTKSKIV